MADQPTTPGATAAPQPPGAENTADTKTATPGRPTEPDQPAAGDKDPMQELLEHLQRAQPTIATLDHGLAQRIETLTREGAEPQQRGAPDFRHQVAYALQDIEKHALWPMPMSPEFRSEMSHLAVTAPRLYNRRMLALMRATPALEDKQLINDIRGSGMDIGSRANQNTPIIENQIAALENRVRLAQHPPEPAANRGPANPAGANQPRGDAWLSPNVGQGSPASKPDAAGGQQPVYRRSILDTLLAGMRPKDQGPAPWEPPHTPMAERLAAFEQRTHDERALARAEKAGRAALNALDAFRSGEGAAVMSRIGEAARAEPGGIAGVLSEMREGGRFADLRHQFNNALHTERGVAAAYDNAAAALAGYGQQRATLNEVIARRPEAVSLSAKFEQMDAEIGEAAANTPSRHDGKTMMDDLAQKAAELLQRAVDAVKAAFGRSPSAAAGAAPSPSMSM
jgi:hypothetical protein